MLLSTNFFLFISLLTTLSGILVITSSNIILSVIALVNVFLLSSILVMMSGLNFLAITLVLIYVGAIAIFFLFAIMMLDIKIQKTNINNKIMFFGFGSLYMWAITPTYIKNIIWTEQRVNNPSVLDWAANIFVLENIQAIGQLIYTNLFIHFLLAGYILFIAILGSMLLTLETPKKSVKKQNISDQVKAKKSIKKINYLINKKI